MDGRHTHIWGVGTLIVLVLVMAGLTVLSQYNYLFFHVSLELFSIIVGCAIFMIAWNTRRYLSNDYLMILAVAYLCVSVIDFIHTLVYEGMQIFPGYGANSSTQLWICARFVESVSLLIAPLICTRKLRTNLILLIYGLFLAFVFLSVFYWRNFPPVFR